MQVQKIVILFIVLVAVIIVIGGYFFEWTWTGVPGATFWDWLELLIVPAVIAILGFWFNRQMKERELRIAQLRAQDDALEAYFKQVSELLTDNEQLAGAQPDNRFGALVRARTLTLLTRLNNVDNENLKGSHAGSHKGSVVRFLYEVGLITNKDAPVVDLSGAPLSRAHVVGLDVLRRRVHNPNEPKPYLVTLCGANLSGTLLDEALLHNTDLSDANLKGAVLPGANLSLSKLTNADLSNTNLSQADLERADLSDADLTDASLVSTNLNGAYLNRAKIWGGVPLWCGPQ